MNERIRQLRKSLNLTQQELADKLKIGRGTLANYELGRNAPIDAVIHLICKEFNVNERWLRTGEGDMFTPEPVDVLDALALEYGLGRRERIFVEKLLNLKPEAREAALNYLVPPKSLHLIISNMQYVKNAVILTGCMTTENLLRVKFMLPMIMVRFTVKKIVLIILIV